MPLPVPEKPMDPELLEAVPNPNPEADYWIQIETPEFTCVCPMTRQPDFAHLTIRYRPGEKIVELKSLKHYIWSYRDAPIFHEGAVNRIFDDLKGLLEPRELIVRLAFLPRGGIHTTVERHEVWERS